jgi:site-specific recombinase XerD
MGIYYTSQRELNMAIKNIKGIKWSQTRKCWYLPMSRTSYQLLQNELKTIPAINTEALKQFLETKKKMPATRPLQAHGMQLTPNNKHVIKTTINDRKLLLYKSTKIHPVNAQVLNRMLEVLLLKAYSRSTIRTYLNEMAQLLQTLKNIEADRLEREHLKRYLIYCYQILHLKENTLHSRTNAMKFYYEQVLGRENFFWEIPRPKKQLILPKILSDREIGKMFSSIKNPKHKAIVFTAYSAGLRVSEVVHLKLKDIDSARMTIFIETAKGKKDRVVNLSPLLLDVLRAYIKECKPRPEIYLFEGDTPGKPYSIRSAQAIFMEAKLKAGIAKTVGFHSLRHSFATHLLEKGVDIRYIKDILGHYNIKTTERYTHVSRRALVNIVSPLDDLFMKGIL